MLEHSDALIATQSPIIISIKFTMYKHFITGQFLKNGLHTIIPLKKYIRCGIDAYMQYAIFT